MSVAGIYTDDILTGHKPLVVHSENLVFFLTPKVCTTSLKTVLRPFNPVYRDIADWPSTYISIAIVRHPLDRLVSCYTNKIQRVDIHETWKKNDRDPLPTNPKMSFSKFVNLVADQPDDISDRHYRSQIAQLSHNGIFLPQITVRYEDLDIEWGRLIQKIIPVANLPKKNSSLRKPWAEYYTRRTKALALQRYKEDMGKFGY